MDDVLRREWYARGDVQSNIVACLIGRETAFMVPFSLRDERGNYPVRCVKAHCSSYLLNNMRAFDFFNRKYNLYHSIYRVRNMPMFSYNPMQRREQQNEFFRNYDSYVEGVDFVMDFDGDKKLPLHDRIEGAREQTIKVCAILDEFRVSYNLVFSGSKGFHIEKRDFPALRDWRKRIEEFSKIATLLVLTANGESPQIAVDQESRCRLIDFLSRCSFDKGDEGMKQRLSNLEREPLLRLYLKYRYHFDSSIYTVTRIWKCPFSYDVSTDMIAYPLSTEELLNFKIEKYHVANMLGKNHWGVGLKTRQGTVSGFYDMAKVLGVDCADGS